MAEPAQAEGIGPRERRWLLVFLILGSGYFGVLLLQLTVSFLGGFSQIILIIFLAWLLAFVISPIARFLYHGTALNWPLAVLVSYSIALVALGFVLFYTGAAITTEVSRAGHEFRRRPSRFARRWRATSRRSASTACRSTWSSCSTCRVSADNPGLLASCTRALKASPVSVLQACGRFLSVPRRAAPFSAS